MADSRRRMGWRCNEERQDYKENMEDLLSLLMKDAQAAKFNPIRQACQKAIDVLRNKEESERHPAYALREECLKPLQLALESRTKRLMTHAVSGVEKILKDGRFQSSIESECEDRWLPIQILNAVYSTPNLPEDIQVDVMKLLLKMTFSTVWCMNSRIITQVVQVYIDTYSNSSLNLRAVVQAALTQLLGSFAEKLQNAVLHVEHAEDDIMSDFNAKGDSKVESLTDDVVTLLNFLIDKVTSAHRLGHHKQAIPLLLEGIYAILTNSPTQLRNNFGFQQLVWQNLCPTLISLLGIPKAEVKQKSVGEHGRNIECPNVLPNTAKIIYSISVTIAKMVGPVRSLRPVLESLFHRILLCPSPQHRHDAIKAVKELFVSPESLCDLTVTYSDDEGASGKKSAASNDLALVKLMVDSIQECCNTNDSAMCYTTISCVDDFLAAIKQLEKGIGIHGDSVEVIQGKYQGKFLTPSKRTCSVTSEGDDSAAENINNNNSSSLFTSPDMVSIATEQTSTAAGNHTSENENVPGVNLKGGSKDIDSADVSDYKDIERQSAKQFVEELSRILPHLLSLPTTRDVDDELQKFSSSFSDNLLSSETVDSLSLCTVLNGDSIYATSYAALSLNLNLSAAGYYNSRDASLVTKSELQFIDCVLDTDMFLYLSPDWLAEIYRYVLERDLLTQAGYSCEEDTVLISALKDIDGQGSHALGGQMLRETVFDEQDEDTRTCNSDLIEAGKLLAHQILSVCWEGILDVLSVLLNGRSSSGVTNTFAIMIGTEGAKEESLRKREALCKCLDGLQKAANLCCSLGLQERCTVVFALLADTSCVMEDFCHTTQITPDRTGQKTSIIPQSKPKLVRLHATHVLSMDAMMTTGLEIGSHSADCWKHVLRCCAFISELEHTYFSSGNNQSSLPRIHQEHAVDMATIVDNDGDIYGIPMAPVVPVAPRINVPNLIKQSSIESGWDRSISGGGVLNAVQASHALCGLSQEVDSLFEEAAERLNMAALTAFLSNLCESSKHQLQKLSRRILEEEDHPGDYHLLPVNSLHLYRLQNVLMKVAHSDRPLIHLIKAWSVVSSYLVESAGHKDRSISKMAVTCVHDYIIAVMSCHTELKHFHTNEMLCKTFENVLCLELCDGDVQDQIVCSICELVEASAADVKSGWRPLFGALRAVRIEYTTIEEVNEARQRHIEAVLDVFDVYLNTDNILVFSYATVDCILCLLKYVRGPGEYDDSDSEDSDSVSDFMASSAASENLCIPALQYLKQCSIILQSMWKMPACPVFHGAKRIQVNTLHRCVDPNIPNMNFKKFSKYFMTEGADECVDTRATGAADSSPSHFYHVHREALHVTEDKGAGDSSSIHSNDSGIIINANKDSSEGKTGLQDSPLHVDLASLDDMDNHTGILHVWFLLLEGLSGAISACPKSFQPHTMETLFELLRSSAHIPGAKFGVYCMNHLLLPMIQSWLRSGSRKFGYWETGATNFKQCCGHTTDLVVDLIHDFKDDSELAPLLESVLKKLLVVLTECVAQPFEVISRLGCSCMRHVLLSASNDFSESMWLIIIDGLQSALDVTTYCVRQLMLLFKANSENFYGDIGQVKVATRKDCTAMEFYRLQHLAQQVFLLESQVSGDIPVVSQEEDKSYVFLLYPPGYENSLNPDHILARAFCNSDSAPVGVPFRSIVVGLLSHQLLLQTVGCILLEGSNQPDSSMPRMLSQLSTKNVLQLLDCLRNSYKLACEFDLRPGLKFLVQKVAHTKVAVNLYKQAGASMVFYIHTLIKICSNMPNLSLQSVRALLSKENTKSTAELKSELGHSNNIETNVTEDSKDFPNKGKKDTCPLKEKEKETKDSDDEQIDNSGNDEIDEEDVESGEKSLAESVPDELCLDSHGAAFSQDMSSTDVTIGASVTANIGKTSTVEEVTEINLSQTVGAGLRKENGKDTELKNIAKNVNATIVDNPSLFVSQLQCMCDELCQTYIDIVYDKAGTSCVDNMGDQQLFFLIAQPDEFPEVQNKLDLTQLSNQLEQTQARLQGQAVTQVVSVQGEEDVVVPPPASVRVQTESVLPPLSPVHSQEKSKREMRTDQESRVYNLATDKLIKNLMTEYKKRKNQHAMPTFSKVNKKEKKEKKAKKKSLGDPVEQVIEQQQHSSIMKDSEAHLQSWTELLCTILGLFHQLDDTQFSTLLPTVFGCVNHLVCHAQDMRLREDLAQWLHRVGTLFTLSSISDSK